MANGEFERDISGRSDPAHPEERFHRFLQAAGFRRPERLDQMGFSTGLRNRVCRIRVFVAVVMVLFPCFVRFYLKLPFTSDNIMHPYSKLFSFHEKRLLI